MDQKPDGVGREVLFEIVDDHVAVITLNRPDQRNAVDRTMAQAVGWLVRQVEADPKLRVGVLASSHPRAFCAGADLNSIVSGQGGPLDAKGSFAGFTTTPRAKPWIAAVAGWALAGGLEMVLACDMVVAAEGSRFALPEVKRGLVAGSGGTYRLPRRLPRNIALEMIATGEPIDAERAYQLGLVNRLTTVEALREEALALAASISAAAPSAVRAALAIARLATDHPDREMGPQARAASFKARQQPDAKEGSLAFLEKRPPVWSAD